MKYVSLILIVSLFPVLANAQKSGARLIELGLKGRVKQVIDTYQHDIDKSIQSYNSLTTEKKTIDFDQKGNQTDEILNYEGGGLKKTIFIYLKRKVVEKAYINNKSFSTNIRMFDGNGNELRSEWKNEAKYGFRYFFKYDAKGNKIEDDADYYSIKQKIKSTYKYNTKNQIVEVNIAELLPTSTSVQKYIYKYDLSGHKIKSELYDENGKLIQEFNDTYENFDSHGNWQLFTDRTEVLGPGLRSTSDKETTKRQIVYFQ